MTELLPALQHYLEHHISLAADVCDIKSKVFPDLGSMMQSNMSGWLCGMQRQKGKNAQALGVRVSYETSPEVNLGSLSIPFAEIWKQAVIDATASHMFASANAFPGQILAHFREKVAWKFGNAYRCPKPNTICLGSSGSPSMKRSGRKNWGSSYISGFPVIPLRNILKELS